MLKINLKNVSFNKLKEFMSSCSKKNIKIKGKFTLIGEYQQITEQGEKGMTEKQTIKVLNTILERLSMIETRLDKIESRLSKIETRLDKVESRLDKVESRLEKVESRLDKVESRLDNIVKLNNLKE